MIQKLLFSMLLLISVINCKAQIIPKTKTKMLHYTKKIKNLEVKMFVESNIKDKKTSWNIYLYNSKKDSILIDHIEALGVFDEKKEHIYGDIRKEIIIGDVVLNNKTIYLMIYRMGKAYLNTYEFINDKKFIKNEYFSAGFVTGSYQNYGSPFYKAEIKVLPKHEVYINFEGGTSVFGGNGNVRLLKFDELNKKLTKVVFNKSNAKIITDDNVLFEIVNINDRESIDVEIKKVLFESELMKEGDNYSFIDVIYDYIIELNLEKYDIIDEGIIYIFYQINNNNTQIIRYDSDEQEWLIEDFKEERIKSE